jgi:predicted DsbA family dithiol-disulfide isomerase
MHNLLFEKEQPLDDERLARLAAKAGLDIERYTRDMAEGAYAARVSEDFMAALYGGGVTGTPTLYLNEVRLSNIQNLENLLQAVTEAGAIVQASSSKRSQWLSRLRKFRVGITRLRS